MLPNPVLDSKQFYINEVPINGRDTYDMYERLNETFIDKSYDLTQYWDLQKSLLIINPLFESEFKDKSKELEDKSSFPEYWDVRYGFLATIKEKMIERVAEEGLEVKMCPYNYLGHNIAGVHISQHADVCLKEARSKIVLGDELILILFKYMLGKRKIVAMHDPKVLLAPTPKFDSHICEERPDPMEKDSVQYIKSLVYLYEFANGNMDPLIRPRHCCPMAAMIFKNNSAYEPTNIAGLEQSNSYSTLYQSPLSLLKPVSQHTPLSSWGRQYQQGEFKKSSSNLKFDEKESRKPIASESSKELYEIEKNDESWRPINYGSQYMDDGIRDSYGLSGNGGSESMLLKPVERERSSERIKKWNDIPSSRGASRNGRGFDGPRRASSRGAKTWYK